MSNLVRIERNDCFTDSWVIAESTGRDHASITYNIKKYEDRLKQLGTIYSSATRINKRGRPAEVFDLNETQTLFLLTLMDNSDIILDFMELSTHYKEIYQKAKLQLQQIKKLWTPTKKLA